jgi:hypothetical protein
MIEKLSMRSWMGHKKASEMHTENTGLDIRYSVLEFGDMGGYCEEPKISEV